MKKRRFPINLSDEIWSGDIKHTKQIFKNIGEDDFFGANFLGGVNVYRSNILKLVLTLIFFVFLLRLFQLTVVYGEKNRDLSLNNRVRVEKLEAKRGRILDRGGKVLAYSQDKYFLEKDGNVQEITQDQAVQLSKEGLAGEDFSGSLGKVTKRVVRVYPYGEMTAHVLGYTSIAQEADISQNSSLTPGEFIGRLGLEETYDNVLRGQSGKKIVEVDSSGKIISIFGMIDAKSGQDITVNIDVDLQKAAYEAMTVQLSQVKEKSGSLVVLDVENGEILTLLSFPSFDPADIGKSVADDDKPLFDRAIGGQYAPGSVFKIVSSLAGLDSGKITKDTEIEDTGQFMLGGVKFANWYYLTYGSTDGILKLDRALARSNDIYFFKLGQEVGLEAIRKWALLMGFGQATGVDLPGESFGLVPDEKWKDANFSDSWYLGDTMHLSIGQGFAQATPIQVGVMTAYVANGGRKITPHLVSKVEGANGVQIETQNSPNNCLPDVETCPKAQDLDLVRSGMLQACQEKGTAWPFFKEEKYKTACKTGTAEITQGNPHAWFTAYAPFDFPKLAIVVMIENGGEGSSVAAPVAKRVFDWYFTRR